MKKETLKWVIAIGVVLAVGVTVFFGCGRSGDGMEAVSEDGRWEAYALETTAEGNRGWRGVVVYKGEEPENIQDVRTQVCVNGAKEKYVKRQLSEAGTLGIKRSRAGGEKQFYVFLEGMEKKPASLSVKVKWTENDTVCTEKMWLIMR